MLLFSLMILVSLAAGAAFYLSAGAALWQAALLALGIFFLCHVLFLLAVFVVGLFIDTSKPLEKQSVFMRRAARFGCFIICLYCGLKPELSGLEKLPKDERFLLVCNHRSVFDPLFKVHVLAKYNMAFVSKPSNMRLPLVGSAMHGMGCLGIDRENDRNALKTILQAADYLKRDICSIAIYPEGKRSKDCRLLPFHAGSFKTAQRAGVGIAVASIRGTENVLKNVLRRRTVVRLDILEFIPAEKVKAMATAELSQYSRELIEGDLKESMG